MADDKDRRAERLLAKRGFGGFYEQLPDLG